MIEQKPYSIEDLQLAHHLVNELFLLLGAMNPWIYPAQGSMAMSLGAPREPWQGGYRSFGPTPGMTPVWPGSARVMPFGQGFIPFY